MTGATHCSRCGAPLAEGATGSVCPACLLKLGLAAASTSETTLSSLGAGATKLATATTDGETRLGAPTGAGEAATVLTSPGAAPVPPRTGSAPTQIGPYRLVKVLGEGGMGVVYLAEQDEPIRRTVALKLIKLGMDTREVVGRFEAERQTLALMDHPNIATVLDAGATPDGRPYFVMEYAPGVPITDYCDAHRLDTGARLHLFITVCGAVQHAHQKGVIHRDLKPSNVLVVEQDGRPTPKVIDFGIAKATDQRMSERAAFTQHGLMVGTPEYMSPEQADPAGAVDLDTRTDIYALGVVLYELLVGGLPFPPTRLREAGYTELLRIIREEEPARPSTRLTSLGATAADVAARRRTKPPTLAQELRGDLDWITLKALEKDRQRRYGSASELAADLTRYLQHEPVVARPPSVRYRVGKFVRRNRLAVTAASLVATAVVAGLVVSLVLYARAERNRLEAIAQRDRADTATQTALDKAASEARQRALADAATKAEVEARLAAQTNLAAAETNLYFNNIDLADREWADHNISHADELLAAAPARLRNWEWHYLSRLVHMEDAAIPAGGAIKALAFSADGRRFFTVDADLWFTTWNAQTRRQTGRVRLGGGRHVGQVEKVVIGPEGALVAAVTDLAQQRGGPDRAFSAWDTATGQRRFVLPAVTALWGPTAFAFGPDGRRLVTGTMQSPASNACLLRSWNTATGEELRQLGSADGPITSLAFSPDGARVAALGNADVRLIDATSGQSLATLGKGDPFTLVAFSQDGATLAGVVGQNVHAWSAGDGRELWSNRLDGRASGLAVAPDGAWIGVGVADRSVRVFDRATGRVRVLVGHTAAIGALAFRADEGRLVSGGDDDTLREWAMRSVPPATLVNGGRNPAWDLVKVSPDRRWLMTRSRDGDIAAWDAQDGRPLALLASRAPSALPDLPFFAAFSADGRRAVFTRRTAIKPESGSPWTRYELTVLDSSGQPVALLKQAGADGPEVSLFPLPSVTARVARDVALDPTGDAVALAYSTLDGKTQKISGGAVEFWDVTGRRAMGAIELPGREVQRVRFDGSGRRVAVGIVTLASSESAVTIYDTASRREVRTFPGATGTLAFSRDGTRLAAVTQQNTVAIWNSGDGTLFARLPPQSPAPSALAFSPDGLRLAALTNGIVTVFETASGRQFVALRNAPGAYDSREFELTGRLSGTGTTTMGFSQDGRQILLGTTGASPRGTSYQVKTWDGTPVNRR